MSQKLEKLIEELKTEADTSQAYKETTQAILDAFIDQNEEFMATFVEGTRRGIKSADANTEKLQKSLKSLDMCLREMRQSMEMGSKVQKDALSAIERSVKSQKFEQKETDTSKLEKLLADIQKQLKKIDFPKDAKDPIAVRLSNGKEFIEQLERVVVASGGSGGGRNPFVKADGSAGHPKVSPDGYLIVVKKDGTDISGGSSGGGTEYTDGDVVPVAEGTVFMGRISGNDALYAVNIDANHNLVIVPSDPIPVTDNGASLTVDGIVSITKSSTATLSNVNDTASSTTLLALNTDRIGATIFNDSTSTLYVKLGTTASTTSFTYKLAAEDTLEIPFGYTGRIDGIWSSDASGAARITEFT